MADHLDLKTNTILAFRGFGGFRRDGDYRSLLLDIALNSDGQLNQDQIFLGGKLSDAETGPWLKQELSKAWDERKYQSIRDIGPSISPSASAEGYGLRTLEGDDGKPEGDR